MSSFINCSFCNQSLNLDVNWFICLNHKVKVKFYFTANLIAFEINDYILHYTKTQSYIRLFYKRKHVISIKHPCPHPDHIESLIKKMVNLNAFS